PPAIRGSASVSGLFRCRGDISGPSLLRLTRHHAPPGGTSAAQVHLADSLTLYEPSGFPLPPCPRRPDALEDLRHRQQRRGATSRCAGTPPSPRSRAASPPATRPSMPWRSTRATLHGGLQPVRHPGRAVRRGRVRRHPSGRSIRTACPMAEAWLRSCNWGILTDVLQEREMFLFFMEKSSVV
ncbi:unnamed protein product, partial [Urochloa humidicola]